MQRSAENEWLVKCRAVVILSDYHWRFRLEVARGSITLADLRNPLYFRFLSVHRRDATRREIHDPRALFVLAPSSSCSPSLSLFVSPNITVSFHLPRSQGLQTFDPPTGMGLLPERGIEPTSSFLDRYSGLRGAPCVPLATLSRSLVARTRSRSPDETELHRRDISSVSSSPSFR